MKGEVGVFINQVAHNKKTHEESEGMCGYNKVKDDQQRCEDHRGIQGRHKGEDRVVGFIVVLAVGEVGPAVHAPEIFWRMEQETVGDILKQRPEEQGDSARENYLPQPQFILIYYNPVYNRGERNRPP